MATSCTGKFRQGQMKGRKTQFKVREQHRIYDQLIVTLNDRSFPSRQNSLLPNDSNASLEFIERHLSNRSRHPCPLICGCNCFSRTLTELIVFSIHRFVASSHGINGFLGSTGPKLLIHSTAYLVPDIPVLPIAHSAQLISPCSFTASSILLSSKRLKSFTQDLGWVFASPVTAPQDLEVNPGRTHSVEPPKTENSDSS